MQSVLQSLLLLDQDWCRRLLQWHIFNNNTFILPILEGIPYNNINARYLLSVPLINPWYFLGWTILSATFLLVLYWIIVPIDVVRVSDLHVNLIKVCKL